MNTALNHLSNKYVITEGNSPSAIILNKSDRNVLSEAKKVENILFGFAPDKYTFIYRMQQYGQLLNSIHFSREYINSIDPVINYLTDKTWFNYDYDLVTYNLNDVESIEYTLEFEPDFTQDDIRGVNLLNVLVNLYTSEDGLALEIRDLNQVLRSRFYSGDADTSLEALVKDLGITRFLYGNYNDYSHWKEEHWKEDSWLYHWLDETYDETFSWHIYKFFRPERTIKQINSTLKAEVDIDKLKLSFNDTNDYIKNMANHKNAMYSTAGYCCALIQSNIENG